MISEGKVKQLDFVVAGAQKCGTTALHSFLEQHPQIALPDRQELHFFDDEELFSHPIDYLRLHEHFAPSKKAIVAGENTPSYLFWRPALDRIATYNSAIKVIVILRNPVRRAFSHWNMQRERGFEPRDFLPAIRAEVSQLQAAAPEQSRRYSYLARGFYVQQLERVFRLFPREHVHVIKFENFRRDQNAIMEEVFRFLDLEPLRKLRNKERNAIRYAREMREEEAEAALDFFRDEIPRVEQLLSWDCSDWRKF